MKGCSLLVAVLCEKYHNGPRGRQINQTIQESNNEILSQILSILDSRLFTVQRNINETQKVIAERQEAKFEQVFFGRL